MSSNGTISDGTTPVLGFRILQVDDFYQRASLLHPFAVGSIAILCLFVYLRLSSNRCVAPLTVFDWLSRCTPCMLTRSAKVNESGTVNIALGSTLAGIVNGNSLVRGLLGLGTLLFFQIISSVFFCLIKSTRLWCSDQLLHFVPWHLSLGQSPLFTSYNHRLSRTSLTKSHVKTSNRSIRIKSCFTSCRGFEYWTCRGKLIRP